MKRVDLWYKRTSNKSLQELFDDNKRISDYVGMVTRLIFLLAAIQYTLATLADLDQVTQGTVFAKRFFIIFLIAISLIFGFIIFLLFFISLTVRLVSSAHDYVGDGVDRLKELWCKLQRYAAFGLIAFVLVGCYLIIQTSFPVDYASVIRNGLQAVNIAFSF